MELGHVDLWRFASTGTDAVCNAAERPFADPGRCKTAGMNRVVHAGFNSRMTDSQPSPNLGNLMPFTLFSSPPLSRIGHSLGSVAIALAAALSTGPVSSAPIFEVAKPVPLYAYSAVGDINAVVTAPTSLPSPSFVLMGGGPDVDSAFRWLIKRAGITPGSGGRLVVIRATGDGAYDPYIYFSDESLSTSSKIADQWVGGASLGLTSVETLVIPSVKAANNANVNAIVARANIVFIAGGDQSHYIRFWKGTALEQTLKSLLLKNVPLGGTSAGLAVLGQFDYSAFYNSATSDDSMLDPYYKDITFDPSPLSLSGGFIAPPALDNLILDSHFDSRDRMGRLVTFVSRIVAPTAASAGALGCAGGVLPASSSGNKTARGIGIDVETALLVQGNGDGKPVTAVRVTNPSTSSESAVYFVRPSVPPTICKPHLPLSIPNVEVRKLSDSKTVFNLTDWVGVAPYRYIDVISGQLSPADWY
ncbi:MAG: cyanophycinase [Oxalobacteraceae bacterium]|nr:MAG: cyanophycinase [Oxalobacteraceae bacterium]